MVATSGTFSLGMLSLFQSVGPWEVVIILSVLLLLFGGRKLPDLARGLGRGLRNFREELHGVKKEVEQPPEIESDKDADKKLKDD